ncbi:hypothetical protein IP79_07695 [Porphyrobacter sp. AAP60]|nr:hypothetical protein IP79_07695 [Porphyrobacter sp. AAP60]
MRDSSAASRPVIAFLFDLIQDVNVLRPIIRTIAHERDDADLLFLVSRQFEGRDKQWLWRAELDELARETAATMSRFEDPFSAVRRLQERRGIIFSASESNLAAHAVNHHVFLSSPASFVRVTVQHGYECVGFDQNREQTLSHGSSVRFAADVLCGWVAREQLRHLCVSERDKYLELGPPLVLNRLFDRQPGGTPRDTGLVCENLHSVRMRATRNFQQTYLETLLTFAADQARRGRKVAVRPHPGGQFIVKNQIELPQNVVLANKPMFKTDLERFLFGISAPSSVLIDMVLAGIPTAVWRDEDAVLDTTAYAELAQVGTVAEWDAFAEAASIDPAPFLERQRRFLRRTGLDADPQVVRKRLLGMVDAMLARSNDFAEPRLARPDGGTRRVLLVANGIIPTLHISFIKPLAALERAGAARLFTITEKDILKARSVSPGDPDATSAFVRQRIAAARPDLAVFCRYSGPEAETMAGMLREAGVPVVFHIDDDLLNVPRELGEKKFLEHNRSERTAAIRHLIDTADVVYCSTRRLRERFGELGITRDMFAGDIYCSGEIIAPAEQREARILGFMGNDKTPELTLLAPVIAAALERHPRLRFELFGSMQLPPELEGFGDRVQATPPIGDYDAFVAKFRELRWDIGLCPLLKTPFNLVKADTKWVDYTSIGAAVIASRGTAYDSACADGCGILVETMDDWAAAINLLASDPDRRFAQVSAAQHKLRERYSLERLTAQVLDVFEAAATDAVRTQRVVAA